MGHSKLRARAFNSAPLRALARASECLYVFEEIQIDSSSCTPVGTPLPMNNRIMLHQNIGEPTDLRFNEKNKIRGELAEFVFSIDLGDEDYWKLKKLMFPQEYKLKDYQNKSNEEK